MKEQIKPEEIDQMGNTQLRLYIKSIAENAIAHFKSLKGLLTPKLLQNYVSTALEMAKEYKKGGEKIAIIPKDVKDKADEETPTINYEMSELVLIKEYEDNTKLAKELRPKIITLTHETFTIKKQKAIHKEKVVTLS